MLRILRALGIYDPIVQGSPAATSPDQQLALHMAYIIAVVMFGAWLVLCLIGCILAGSNKPQSVPPATSNKVADRQKRREVKDLERLYKNSPNE